MSRFVATENRSNGKWGVMAQGSGRFVGPANLTKDEATAKACRFEHGEAHDAHMALSGECPWCGTYDEAQGGMSVETATEVFG